MEPQRNTTSDCVRKAKHNLTINPIPNTEPYNHERTPNSQLLPEESRVWTAHPAPQPLRFPPEETINKMKTYGMEEKFAKHLSGKGLISNIYKELLQLDIFFKK